MRAGGPRTRVRYAPSVRVGDPRTQVRYAPSVRAGGPRTQARVPGCRFDEGSLPCLVVRSRYGDEKDDFRRGTYHLCYAGRRPAYPGAGLTRVRYLVSSSVRDTATKKMISGAVCTIYAMRAGGPRTQARVPRCRLDEGSLPCLVVRSRCGDDTGSATATACLFEESSHGVAAALRPAPSFSATG